MPLLRVCDCNRSCGRGSATGPLGKVPPPWHPRPLPGGLGHRYKISAPTLRPSSLGLNRTLRAVIVGMLREGERRCGEAGLDTSPPLLRLRHSPGTIERERRLAWVVVGGSWSEPSGDSSA